jgi:hypothetical protein
VTAFYGRLRQFLSTGCGRKLNYFTRRSFLGITQSASHHIHIGKSQVYCDNTLTVSYVDVTISDSKVPSWSSDHVSSDVNCSLRPELALIKLISDDNFFRYKGLALYSKPNFRILPSLQTQIQEPDNDPGKNWATFLKTYYATK